MTKLSLATALLLGMAVFATAADDLASAFKEGKLDGRVRAQYFNTDWDDNSVKKTDAHGLAVGGSLIYKTAPLYGLSAGVGLYTTQNPGGWTSADDGKYASTGLDLFSRDSHDVNSSTTAKDPYGTGYAVLAQSYLQYDIANSKIKAGHFLMTNPWINPNDTKMIPIAIEGADFVSNDIANTTIQLDYANKIKERGMTYFGNMADGLDVPNAIRLNYDTHYNAQNKEKNNDAPGVLVAGIKNKSIDNLELQAWGMNWNNLVSQAMVEANYALEAGDVIVGFGGRYIQQFDQGAGDLIKPIANGDNDNSIDTSLWAVRTTANYRTAKVLLAMSHTSSDGDMIAPWRGFPTDGYTRSKTVTDWNANTTSYKALLDYNLNQYVSGLNTIISYSYYNRDPSKTPYASATNRAFANGDTRQWNLDLIYKLAGGFKGTELKARFMDQKNEPTTLAKAQTSNREMRLEANYLF